MCEIKSLCLIFIVFLPNIVISAEKPGTFLETEKHKQAEIHAPSPVHHAPFNASVDAKHLNDAVLGLGTDENKIISIITHRTNKERQQIRKAYEEQFHKDLIEDLKDDTSGNFRSAIVALMLEPQDFLTNDLHRALNSILPKDPTVAEIICTRSKSELQPIIAMYHEKFNKTLRDEIDENTEESFKSFLKNIISEQTNFRADTGVRPEMIEQQLKSIPNLADFCQPAENKILFDLLSKESFEHINRVITIYDGNNTGSFTVVDHLKEWCQDDMLTEAYLTVVKYAMNPSKFYATRLNDAMVGLGTRDHTLIRIIVSRSEIDLAEIKQVYKELFNTTLASSIENETSGHYKRLLLEVIEK